MSKKQILILLFVIIAAGLVFLYFGGYLQIGKARGTPESFPKELVLVRPETVTQSYETQGQDGTKQSTYGFVSSKTLEELFNIYSAELLQKGWDIKSTSNEPALKSIVAQKGDVFVSISFSSNSITKENSVIISYIYK